MENNSEIRWADYCSYWCQQFCLLKFKKCPWSDLGGYPIIEKCQFYKNKDKKLTNG